MQNYFVIIKIQLTYYSSNFVPTKISAFYYEIFRYLCSYLSAQSMSYRNAQYKILKATESFLLVRPLWALRSTAHQFELLNTNSNDYFDYLRASP